MPPPRGSNQTGKRKRMSKNANTTDTKDYPDSCLFCEASDDDEEIYGRKVRKCGITVHYFCMLFSSGLSQRGKTEEDGIYGFLPSDIGKEKSRGARLRCTFCRKNGATIGCVVKNCRRVFHFGCGQKAGALNQYFDSYRSFCTSHRPRQTCPVSDRLSFYGTANSMCVICMSAVEARASNETLRAPCCKNTWFHRKCIQRQALAAGLYFFKCPLCCNKEIFQAEMLQVGIYIPEQDAAWEMEPHAYQELLEPYNHCDMDSCLCPRGRKYNRDDSKWEIVVCHWCGSQGSHIGCISKRSTSNSGSRRVRWSCQSCALIDGELRKERKKKKASCSPVNQESSDVPSGKSLTPSEHIGRKLPVKRSSTLQTPSLITEQNDGESSSSSPSVLTGDNSGSSMKPRGRQIRRRKRNLWKRGLLLRTTAKKRKVTSATVTQAEASIDKDEKNCLDGESHSQQVNVENVNPAIVETPRSKNNFSASEAAGSSQVTAHVHKKRRPRPTMLRKLLMDSGVLSDIKNNKLCDSSAISRSTSKLRRRALGSNSPYVLRDRKNSDASLNLLFHQRKRRTLRSGKNLSSSPWKNELKKSSLKSTALQKEQKLQDGNNNNKTALCLSLPATNETFFKPQKSNMLLSHSSPPSPCATIEISRESQSPSCASPVFSNCFAMNTIGLENDPNRNIEKIVKCDCFGCSDLVVISTDDESEEGEESSSSSSPIMSLSFNETDSTDNSGLFIGETEACNALFSSTHLQEQKCDDPNCDCRSADFWAYPTTELLPLKNLVLPLDSATSSTYQIADSTQFADMKHFIESTPGSALPSPSSSSVITLTSSSDYESCKSTNELNANSCPFEMQTI